MQNNALTRQDIVDALDDLSEREELSSAWVEDGDAPYPLKAVQERSKRLRWRLQWRRRGFIVLMALLAIVGGLDLAGWAIPGFVVGALGGIGMGALIAFPFGGKQEGRQARALQLYDLLKQIDGDTEVVSEPSSAKVA